ncbi:hypothetical protein BD410DRAFT_798468 [Rickenella mellea]|uniref:Uncharacterized protein n=1 Tax=Rickenella mellea TaxID=50990 RepID=A0A4R5XI95_9AGAM|nr:hypothetical protein BD410DRAFT_798468 [Rickenella mellea]
MADSKIKGLQEHTPLFLQKGLQYLPDDLLRRVFEVGYEDHNNNNNYNYNNHKSGYVFAMRVSSVSSHFRRVALDSPRIWRRVNNYMSADILTLLIDRSKNADLYITVKGECYDGPKPQPLESFMKTVIKECHRWAAFSYDRRVDGDGVSILCQYPDLQLPRLSSIAYRTHCPDEMMARDALDVFRRWNLPQLHHLSIFNGFVHDAAGWASLTSCTLNLDWHNHRLGHGDGEWDVCMALDGLTVLPSLESLSLIFSSFEESKFFSSIRTPLDFARLKTLSLTFYTCNDEGFITSLVCSNPYPSLQSLTLKGERDFSGSVTLALFADKLPPLTSISVEEFERVRPFDELNKVHFFPWKIVRLKDIGGLSENDVTVISEALMRCPQFQRLEILHCSSNLKWHLRTLKSRMGNRLLLRTYIKSSSLTYNFTTKFSGSLVSDSIANIARFKTVSTQRFLPLPSIVIFLRDKVPLARAFSVFIEPTDVELSVHLVIWWFFVAREQTLGTI